MTPSELILISEFYNQNLQYKTISIKTPESEFSIDIDSMKIRYHVIESSIGVKISKENYLGEFFMTPRPMDCIIEFNFPSKVIFMPLKRIKSITLFE